MMCYEALLSVTDEATKQFGPSFYEDDRKKNALKPYCEIIDFLSERFDAVSFEVEIGEETTDIILSLICHEFEILKKNDPFYYLLLGTKSFSIESLDKEYVQLDFVFEGIWNY